MEQRLDCLLIADDLTGACDAAAPFAAAGLTSVVALAGHSPPVDCRVLAVTTETRDGDEAEVRRAMHAAAMLAIKPAGILFKKIDSTLRGNAAIEITAALEEFRCRAAVVCPAFPAMNRMVQGGYLRVVGASDFEPIHLATRISCTHIPAGELRSAVQSGERIVSLDANCDEDLDRMAAAILALDGPILWAGSAGLASALARRLAQPAAPAPPPERTGPVLFCIGSDHPVTLGQQEELLSAGKTVPGTLDSAAGSIAGALGRGRHVLLRIPRGRVSPDTVRDLICDAAPAALVLSGGDTASLVCRALGVQSIVLCDELVPGIPRGILRGGMFDGVPVVTKSGGFGYCDTLIRIADYFA